MKNILLVDDSSISRNILKTVLINHYNIIEAESGQDALKKLEENEIDFFLMDLNMPGMDGITLTKEVKKNNKYKSTPILIMTTEIREDKKHEAKEAGINGWIAKDCDSKKLITVIDQLLK